MNVLCWPTPPAKKRLWIGWNCRRWWDVSRRRARWRWNGFSCSGQKWKFNLKRNERDGGSSPIREALNYWGPICDWTAGCFLQPVKGNIGCSARYATWLLTPQPENEAPPRGADLLASTQSTMWKVKHIQYFTPSVSGKASLSWSPSTWWIYSSGTEPIWVIHFIKVKKKTVD